MLKLILLSALLPNVCLATCPDDLDPRGKVIGHDAPDYDPIHENLGPVVGHTFDGTPIYQKTGVTYAHEKGRGNVTGYTYDGDKLYDGEREAKYGIDGDRETPQNSKRDKSTDWL